MKKLILLSFVFLTSVFCLSAQDAAKQAAPAQFTKTELLAFPDVKAILKAIDKTQDYSTYMVRNFNITTTITNADGTTSKLSEMGPGGTVSAKQKELIQKYAVKGVVFSLENVTMIESGKKGKTELSSASLTIKE